MESAAKTLRDLVLDFRQCFPGGPFQVNGMSISGDVMKKPIYVLIVSAAFAVTFLGTNPSATRAQTIYYAPIGSAYGQQISGTGYVTTVSPRYVQASAPVYFHSQTRVIKQSMSANVNSSCCTPTPVYTQTLQPVPVQSQVIQAEVLQSQTGHAQVLQSQTISSQEAISPDPYYGRGTPVEFSDCWPTMVTAAPTACCPPVVCGQNPSNHYIGRGIVGQMKVYVSGQSIRNALRFITP